MNIAIILLAVLASAPSGLQLMKCGQPDPRSKPCTADYLRPPVIKNRGVVGSVHIVLENVNTEVRDIWVATDPYRYVPLPVPSGDRKFDSKIFIYAEPYHGNSTFAGYFRKGKTIDIYLPLPQFEVPQMSDYWVGIEDTKNLKFSCKVVSHPYLGCKNASH